MFCIFTGAILRMHVVVCVCSVMSRLLQPPWTARLSCSWDFPGKNTGVGCHFLCQRTLPTQGSNLYLLRVVGGCHQPAPALPPTPSEVMINQGGWGCEETAAHPGPGASSGQDGGTPGIHSGTMGSKAWFPSLLLQGRPTQTLPLTLGLPPQDTPRCSDGLRGSW